MPKTSLMLEHRIRMMESLGFDSKQSQLLAMGSLNLDITEIKEEIQCEHEMIAEEAKNFIPLQQTLDDFKDEDTYTNLKDESSIISSYQKNPVYKTVKPKMGRMIIDKETGERKIIYDE